MNIIKGLALTLGAATILAVSAACSNDSPPPPPNAPSVSTAPGGQTIPPDGRQSTAASISSVTQGSAAPSPEFQVRSAMSMVDFITFGGIDYLTYRIDKEVPLQDEDLGPEYGRVVFKYEGNVSDPDYKLEYGKDGDAAFLEVGTPVYTVKGYKAEFILAARRNTSFVLYLSDSNPSAKTGSDLLDLEGNVNYISVNSSKDGKTELAAINDQSQIDMLVRLVLNAPVDQELRNDSESDVYFLAFHLKDGITVTRAYRVQDNRLDRGIKLPDEFGSVIENALGEGQTETPVVAPAPTDGPVTSAMCIVEAPNCNDMIALPINPGLETPLLPHTSGPKGSSLCIPFVTLDGQTECEDGGL